MVTKLGSSLRLDFTLVGFENMSWVYGDLSAIFHGREFDRPGELAIVDWSKKTVRYPVDYMSSETIKPMSLKDASECGRKRIVGPGRKQVAMFVNFIPRRLAALLTNDIVVADSDIDRVTFKEKTSWLGKVKTEKIDVYDTTLYEMSDMHITVRKRQPHQFDIDNSASSLSSSTTGTTSTSSNSSTGIGLSLNDSMENKHVRFGRLDVDAHCGDKPVHQTNRDLVSQ